MGAAQQFSQRAKAAAPARSEKSPSTVASLPGMDVAGIDRPAVIVTGPGQVIDLAIPNPNMPRPALTDRERDVLLCWLTSDSKTAVSSALGLSDGTVKTHLHRIRGKYEAVGRNASTKAALVARALQDGLIGLEDL